MNEINTGGPAFPTNRINMHGEVVPDEEGMTLRDYFAAKALMGFCTTIGQVTGEPFWGAIATDAYKMADAMLKERMK